MPSSDSSTISSASAKTGASAATSAPSGMPLRSVPTCSRSSERFARTYAIGLLSSCAMPAASSPTAASRPEVRRRLRSATTSRRSRTISTMPLGPPRWSRCSSVESETSTGAPRAGSSRHSTSRSSRGGSRTSTDRKRREALARERRLRDAEERGEAFVHGAHPALEGERGQAVGKRAQQARREALGHEDGVAVADEAPDVNPADQGERERAEPRDAEDAEASAG